MRSTVLNSGTKAGFRRPRDCLTALAALAAAVGAEAEALVLEKTSTPNAVETCSTSCLQNGLGEEYLSETPTRVPPG